jgi:uncharacterized protein
MAHPARKLIVNLSRNQLICADLTVADDLATRVRGLLGRRALRTGEGLLLTPAPSIHTAFMRFPIDVVFVDADLSVVKLVQSMRPWRVAAARRARSALELEAGAIAAAGIRVGDCLSLLDLEMWQANRLENVHVHH